MDLPVVVLLVSGGHTLLVLMEAFGRYRLIGQTLDDAAGEAFDKVARFMDLGYPGGPVIDRLAMDGNPEAVAFPRPMYDDGYDFSFSGLKTAVVNHVRAHPDLDVADVAASFQEAVVDVLVHKARNAAEEFGGQGPVPGGRGGGQLLPAGAPAGCLRGRRHKRVSAQPLHVHRQRGHGGRHRLAAAPARRPLPARHRRRPQPRPPLHLVGRTRSLSWPQGRTGPILSTRLLRVLTLKINHLEAEMALKPLDDRIVVRPGESEEMTASGLVIPDTAKEKPQQGEIIAVGPGKRSENTGDLIQLDVSVGDTVVYSKFGGTEITVDGEDLLILSARDVLAIVK